MIVEIEVGGWEHECCGDPIAGNDFVDWAYLIDADGVRQETHHETRAITGRVRGRVAEIDLLVDGSRVAVDRVPSGAALSGLDSAPDDAVVTRLSDGADVTVSAEARFVVGVEA